MKRSKFTGLLFGAAAAFFLASCGGRGSNEQTNTDTTSAVTPPANTIDTTPQNTMTVIHRVANFAKWKASYYTYDSMRSANGVHSFVVARGFTDSNMVMVVVKVDDMAKAKAFAKDASLKKAMQKGGVTGPATISFTMDTWRDTAFLSQDILRAKTTFTVKDWDAWLKVYEDGMQERTDNGIKVKVISHDADDDKKVSLITALVDTAKAFAYYKSDALKKRREAGGVTGEPDRFLFKIVARY